MRGYLYALTAALLLTACGGPDLSADLVTLEEQVNDVRYALCSCPDVAGFADVAECDAAMGRFSDSEAICVENTLVDEGQAGADYLGCVNSSYEAYLACLSTDVDCEAAVIEACTQAHETSRAGCSQVGATIQQEFVGCLLSA